MIARSARTGKFIRYAPGVHYIPNIIQLDAFRFIRSLDGFTSEERISMAMGVVDECCHWWET